MRTRLSDGARFRMELDRRLRSSVEELTADLVSFREPADVAAAKSDKQAARLVTLTAG